MNVVLVLLIGLIVGFLVSLLLSIFTLKEQIKSTINILPKSFLFAKKYSRFRQ